MPVTNRSSRSHKAALIVVYLAFGALIFGILSGSLALWIAFIRWAMSL